MLLLLNAVWFVPPTGPVQATLTVNDDDDAAIAYALTLT